MVKACTDVIIPFLLCGTPDPTTVKWFSVTLKIKAVALANGVHRLLSRAWVQAFKLDYRRAAAAAEQDDLVAADDYQTKSRVRHRKVFDFFERDNLQSKLMATLAAVRTTEQLQLDLCCVDTSRKSLAKRRRDQRAAKKLRSATQPSAAAAPALTAVGARSASLLDALGDESLATEAVPTHRRHPAAGLLDALASAEEVPFAMQPQARLPDPPSELGMLSLLADSSPTGFRSSIHGAHQKLLTDPTSVLLHADLAPCLRHSRSTVLQQDAEFFMRFDLYYDSFPRKWFTLRCPGVELSDPPNVGESTIQVEIQ